MSRLAFVLFFLAAMAWGGRTQAQSLRSDSPLWTYEIERDESLFPQAFSDGESFGCSIPLRLGVYRRIDLTEPDEESFVRIENYGVFHCALLYGEAYDAVDAVTAFEDHAWLIVLDKVRRPDGGEDELLALQIGIRSGSRYMLLRRATGNLSAPLEELDWRCPANAERRVAHIDIWVQDECVISSKQALRRVALAAARKPAMARLELPPEQVETATTESPR